MHIPKLLADRLGLNGASAVELQEVDDTLVIQKVGIQKPREVPTLKALVDSAKGFRYPEDVAEFMNGAPTGRELI